MTLKPPGPHMEATSRVKAIADLASGINVNPDTHPKHYLRSGRELIRSAASYQEDGQTEHAYILYLRFLTIFLEKLRQHPNYKEVPPSERKLMTEYCNKILPQAEYLKKELLRKYEKEHEEYTVQAEKLRKQAEEQRLKEQQERERLQAENKIPRSDPSPAVSGGYDLSSQFNKLSADGYSSQIPHGYGVTAPTPNVPMPGSYSFENNLYEFRDTDNLPSAPLPSTSSGPSPMPSVDRSTKPSRVLTPISTGIRPLIVPLKLSETFLRYATTNTNKNLETCGLLTGKIKGSQLIITDLIIPKQTGSSDTCNMMNETEIFALQDKFNLITFGWIHTHPSQTAFLSSVDLHTQFSYQVMMPEAIAIVCAPKHNQVGFFTLTPQGMDEVGKCQKSGFHPHSSTGIFTEASHYSLDGSVQVQVHDLR